jgi:hypothetical protein
MATAIAATAKTHEYPAAEATAPRVREPNPVPASNPMFHPALAAPNRAGPAAVKIMTSDSF